MPLALCWFRAAKKVSEVILRFRFVREVIAKFHPLLVLMSQRTLKEAVKKVCSQLKIPQDGGCQTELRQFAWKLPKRPRIAELQPICEIKPFQLPAVQFSQQQMAAVRAGDFPDPIKALHTKPEAASGSEIKGVHDELYFYAFVAGVLNVKALFNCKWFSVQYFHEEHYVSKVSKSRPAVLFTMQNNNIFNQENKIKLSDVKSNLHNKGFPLKFATCRTTLKKLFRNTLFDVYSKDPSLFVSLPGTYKLAVKLYPKSIEEIEDFKKCVPKACAAVLKTPQAKLIQDVKFADAKMNWNTVNNLFRKFNIEPIRPKFKPRSN